MGKALAQEIDRVGLIGTGAANQPTGITNTAGISSVPAVGTPATYSPFVTGLQSLLEANVALDRAEQHAIMSPRTWGNLENLQATQNQPLTRPRPLNRRLFPHTKTK